MSTNNFDIGDHVTSTLLGFYSGLPGTIVKPASFQIPSEPGFAWIVQLDDLDKVITISDEFLQHID